MIPYLDSIGLTGLGETMMYPHLLDVLKHIKKTQAVNRNNSIDKRSFQWLS